VKVIKYAPKERVDRKNLHSFIVNQTLKWLMRLQSKQVKVNLLKIGT